MRRLVVLGFEGNFMGEVHSYSVHIGYTDHHIRVDMVQQLWEPVR